MKNNSMKNTPKPPNPTNTYLIQIHGSLKLNYFDLDNIYDTIEKEIQIIKYPLDSFPFLFAILPHSKNEKKKFGVHTTLQTLHKKLFESVCVLTHIKEQIDRVKN